MRDSGKDLYDVVLPNDLIREHLRDRKVLGWSGIADSDGAHPDALLLSPFRHPGRVVAQVVPPVRDTQRAGHRGSLRPMLSESSTSRITFDRTVSTFATRIIGWRIINISAARAISRSRSSGTFTQSEGRVPSRRYIHPNQSAPAATRINAV